MDFSNDSLRTYLTSIEKMITSFPALTGNIHNNEYFNTMVMANMLTQYDGFLYKQIIPKITDEDIRAIKVKQMLLQSVVVMDFYILVNKKIVLDTATKEEIRMLNQIKSAHKKDNDFTLLISNPNNTKELLNATHLMKSVSYYDKVLAYCLLDDEDISLLSSFNISFMSDYKKYNVKINKNFILKQIFKDINKSNDRITSIEEAAAFLVDAFYADVDGIEEIVVDIINFTGSEDIMQALVDENISGVAIHLFDYYDKITNDGPKLR